MGDIKKHEKLEKLECPVVMSKTRSRQRPGDKTTATRVGCSEEFWTPIVGKALKLSGRTGASSVTDPVPCH